MIALLQAKAAGLWDRSQLVLERSGVLKTVGAENVIETLERALQLSKPSAAGVQSVAPVQS